MGHGLGRGACARGLRGRGDTRRLPSTPELTNPFGSLGVGNFGVSKDGPREGRAWVLSSPGMEFPEARSTRDVEEDSVPPPDGPDLSCTPSRSDLCLRPSCLHPCRNGAGVQLVLSNHGLMDERTTYCH